MKKGNTVAAKPSRVTYDALEEMVREKVQEFIQDILDEEVAEFLGRVKSERIKRIATSRSYRNGKGKTRRLALMNGTMNPPRSRATGRVHFKISINSLWSSCFGNLGYSQKVKDTSSDLEQVVNIGQICPNQVPEMFLTKFSIDQCFHSRIHKNTDHCRWISVCHT